MSALSPTSGATDPNNPFGSIENLMQMLFGGAGAGGATALPPGATSLYAPATSSNTTPGTGSNTATNPFSSFTGSNITQNSNGSVSLSPSTSSPSGNIGAQPQSVDPASMFSSFQQMIAPYMQELQGIGTNAQTANGQIQSSLNSATPAPVAAPSTQLNQNQASQDVLQAVTNATNGIGGSESYGSYWDNVFGQLQSSGFTPDMINALKTRVSTSMNAPGVLDNKGGGNTSSFNSAFSGALDEGLNNYYTSQPTAQPQAQTQQPVNTSTAQPGTRMALGSMRLAGG